jgi:hypothetical protein
MNARVLTGGVGIDLFRRLTESAAAWRFDDKGIAGLRVRAVRAAHLDT